MTGSEFKTARKTRLKLSQAELGIAMQTPKRTIQDIEALGDQDVRGVYAACIELLIWKDAVVMQAVIEKVQRDIDRDHPGGIISAGGAE